MRSGTQRNGIGGPKRQVVHHLDKDGNRPLCGNTGELAWWHWTQSAEQVTCPECIKLLAQEVRSSG